MSRKTSITITITICFLLASCADLQKANLAFHQGNYSLAHKHWQELADLGFPQALIGLGKLAELSAAHQVPAALNYYQQAYQLGYDPAAYQIGQYYYKYHRNPEDLQRAKEWVLKAAEQGSAGAYLLYADMQFYGLGETENIPSAFSIYHQLAELGYPSASRRLAYLHEKGLNVEQDKLKAFDYFKQALAQGSIESELDIGRFYANGYGVEINFDKAESIFQKFYSAENPQAAYLLGDLYQKRFVIEDKPLLEKSFELFKFSAEKGYIPAKIRMIDLMLENNSHDIQLAVEKLKQLSKLNEGKASYRLGRLYSTRKLPVNKQEELEYYKLAYNQGYELAAFRIAEFYFVNQQNNDDLQKAQQWLQKALQQNSDNARFVKADLMLHGQVLTQNKPLAIKILKELSKKGMISASRTLAEIYEIGNHTKQDFSLAFMFFSKAAQQGDTYAELDIARFYAEGIGVKQDWAKAKNIFLQYAQAGYHQAAYLLAKNLELRDIKSDREISEQAISWYQEAAKKNNLSAQLRLIDLKLEGRGLLQDIDGAISELNALSELGVAEASFRLGKIYADQQENADLNKALYYFHRALFQGSRKPVKKLTGLYRQGYGIKDNNLMTSHNEFYDAGHIESAFLLGVLYQKREEEEKALEWFYMAAKHKYIEAQMELVKIYTRRGDMETANEWLKSAALANNGKAMLQYGIAMFWGQHMKADRIQGLAYVLSAAKLHVGGAVAKSLELMVKLNHSGKIELAKQHSTLGKLDPNSSIK